MESRPTEKDERENQKFWKYWQENQSILVVGDSQNNDPEVKTQIADKLGLHKRSITPTTLEKVVFENEEESPFYKEIYSYQGNSVTRFGINVKQVLLLETELGVKTNSYSQVSKKTKDIKREIDKINVPLGDIKSLAFQAKGR